MSSLAKLCPECGLEIELGIAMCPHCGAQVGTVFSEDAPLPEDIRAKRRREMAEQAGYYYSIERARDRANNALVLAIASFFCPGVGFVLGAVSILFGAGAVRTLKAHAIEDGRGVATAGLVIGIIGLVAQTCYVIYAVRMGIPFFG